MAPIPNKISLYTYNVFFGDCFLLVFHYEEGEKRSVLIDFGSTGKGKPQHGVVDDESDETKKDTTGNRLRKVARDIQEKCEGSLDVVVATHRHKDHIYGFGLKEAGQIIIDCKPKIVIQPWTENPEDNRDFKHKSAVIDPEAFKADPRASFMSVLDSMHRVAESIETEALNLADDDDLINKNIDTKLKDKIVFAADDNKIKNAQAVKNLQTMGDAEGSKSHYVYYNYDQIDWEAILPGVKVHILGPPRIEDSSEITSATSTSDEFWSLHAMNQHFWGLQAATNQTLPNAQGNAPLFAPNKIFRGERPPNVRWIIRQLRSVRATQMLELVRFVDSALNNTSVIMLFEVGDEKLLFPGDAQIENWRYVLDIAKKDGKISKLLTETTLYKVGHHGSRNATPKSLWDGFEKKIADKRKPAKPLKTVISTMVGKHGESPETAVPLPKMVDTMKKESLYTSTEDIKNDIVTVVEIPVG